MKPETKLKLTKRNAAAEKFVNGFLKEVLVDFWDDDNDDGNAEAYLGGFTLKDRATAERLDAWMQERFEKLEFGAGSKV